MPLKITSAAVVLAFAIILPVQAEEMAHSKMPMGTMEMGKPKGDSGPSSTAFAEANAKMHASMDITYTGNADADFVRGMIAHHQGAIDMAKIELQYGKDADLRRLAETIIAAQQAEIKTMKAWLEKHGG